MARGGYRRKTRAEKMDGGREPLVKRTVADFADIPSGSRMLIPTPRVVDACIRRIPYGREANIATIRRELARQYPADHTCPVTTGIFLRIGSQAAFGELLAGKPLDAVTPFRRAVRADSPTAGKPGFPLEFLREQQRSEGLAE